MRAFTIHSILHRMYKLKTKITYQWTHKLNYSQDCYRVICKNYLYIFYTVLTSCGRLCTRKRHIKSPNLHWFDVNPTKLINRLIRFQSGQKRARYRAHLQFTKQLNVLYAIKSCRALSTSSFTVSNSTRKSLPMKYHQSSTRRKQWQVLFSLGSQCHQVHVTRKLFGQ